MQTNEFDIQQNVHVFPNSSLELLYYRCKDRLCSGRAKKGANNQMIITHQHNQHEADESYLKIARLRENAFNYSQNSLITPREVYSELCENFSSDMHHLSYNQIKHSLRKWCQLSTPPLPTNLFDIDDLLNSNEIWQKLLNFNYNNENYKMEIFKYVDEVDQRNISVVFGVRKFADNVLQNAICFFADATFKTRPNVEGVYQLLTLMTKRYNKIIPFAWAIMSRKSKVLYKQTFELIKAKIAPRMVPATFMSDYEVALQSAIKETFPNCEIKGCYFHLVHSITKKLKKLGIKTQIENLNEEEAAVAKIFIRKFINLSFLPHGLIETAFLHLCEEIEGREEIFDILAPFILYYKRQWIIKTSPKTFSVYQSIDRTNNGQERYHRYLNDMIGIKPPIHHFFNKIIQSIKNYQITLHQLQRGNYGEEKDLDKLTKWLGQSWKSFQQYLILEEDNITLINKIGEFLDQSINFSTEIFKNIERRETYDHLDNEDANMTLERRDSD
ncbi:uncharacterized protein [Prorops nasuta]|uniref:uncharacterized protein n=1 Tax=Prorops nasuta TaxID=863751 RepID=UPI0034CE42D7